MAKIGLTAANFAICSIFGSCSVIKYTHPYFQLHNKIICLPAKASAALFEEISRPAAHFAETAVAGVGI